MNVYREYMATLARLRWKIELDYRQLKGELGLDHYEGRSYLGWHHHTALVSAAHGFLTLERQHPNRTRSGGGVRVGVVNQGGSGEGAGWPWWPAVAAWMR